MAKKNANSGGSSTLPDPPSYDTSINSKAKAELEANTDSAAAASSMQGVDLSKYRQPQLVEALDRLTSFTYAGSLLLKPALKIMWRSALYQDADVRLQDLLSQLQGTSPITEPPTPSSAHAAPDATPASTAASKQPQRSSKPSRTLAERFVHFFVVGIPMAVLVGLAYGVVNFITCIFADVKTVTQTSQNLFNQAKVDLNHYYQHPEARPTKDQAIDAWTQQIVQPYTQTIVKRKLGPFGFGFIATPIARVVQSVVRVFANSSATELQKYAKKYKGFDVFHDQSVQAS